MLHFMNEKMFVEPPEMFVLPPGCFLPLIKYLKGVQNWQATHLYPSFATGWNAATQQGNKTWPSRMFFDELFISCLILFDVLTRVPKKNI